MPHIPVPEYQSRSQDLLEIKFVYVFVYLPQLGTHKPEGDGGGEGEGRGGRLKVPKFNGT